MAYHFTASHVFMTTGCAGGLNVALEKYDNYGDEIINLHLSSGSSKTTWKLGGIPRFVETKEYFQLDISKIEEAITPKTRALRLNSPNNPTGVVYREDLLKGLAELLYSKRTAWPRGLYHY
jgi:aspartate aminotransferase